MYPNTPGFKEAHTSRDAAKLMTAKSAQLRDQILDAFKVERTADEVAELLGVSVLAVRPRVSELHKMELIDKTGERRRNASGMTAHVWSWAA